MANRTGRPRRFVCVVRCRACGAAVTLNNVNRISFRPDRVCRQCGAVGSVRARFVPMRIYRRMRRRRARDNAVSLPAGTVRQKAAKLIQWVVRLKSTAHTAWNAGRRDHAYHSHRRANRLRRVTLRLMRAGRFSRSRGAVQS